MHSTRASFAMESHSSLQLVPKDFEQTKRFHAPLTTAVGPPEPFVVNAALCLDSESILSKMSDSILFIGLVAGLKTCCLELMDVSSEGSL